MMQIIQNMGIGARPDPFRRTKRLRKILQEAAANYGSNRTEVLSWRKLANIVRAREEFSYRAYTELGMPFQAIANYLNRKDHETIRTAIAMHCVRNGMPFPDGFNGDAWVRRRNFKSLRRKPQFSELAAILKPIEATDA